MLLAMADITLSFDQMMTLIGLVASIIQALVLPITIYLLAVQTKAMREQTTALVLQSKEMIAQTRVFVETTYSATSQGLYDAEAHLGELMMAYPEASRILMNPVFKHNPGHNTSATSPTLSTQLHADDPALLERVRWLGAAMLDFFEHTWTQAQNKGLPPEVWDAWEDYMTKMFSETYLRHLWESEHSYYDPGFRLFVDQKIGIALEIPTMPPLMRKPVEKPAAESPQPQVARVLRAVAEEPHTHNGVPT